MRDYNEMIRQMTDPSYIPTLSMTELYDNTYSPKLPIIDSFLYPGTYIFSGAPKVGKSFMVMQIAFHVAMGLPLWDLEVRQGTVLYLALEDDYARLQQRLFRMFGTDCAENLYLSTTAQFIGKGLSEQLRGFISAHKDTRLVIIDTLKKVREASSEAYSYANDYDVMGELKRISDSCSICLLIVHHTRKQKSDDVFDTISGTTGLFGAADGAMILAKESRTSNSAIMAISGRDQPEQRLYLKFNEKFIWEMVKRENEVTKLPPDPLLQSIGEMVNAESPCWQGTATQLIEALNSDKEPNAFTRYLNANVARLIGEYGIAYSTKRTANAREITLTYSPENKR